ncbi:MAG TPA: 2-oxoacid:acceptor oxidoreductase subunit alpha [Candidatus Dormibacteraeota bacterium]|nr:2-oxoacid:acceptor oxidoreductase subunit alpha [Candidatus Dormibacteraeota bacterium]
MTVLPAPSAPPRDAASRRVNDFAIKLANVNGTGSASANSLLMQAIFRMGVPVSGKNLFPSNIQGLPTWYEIRVNHTGFVARALDYDIVVTMNAQTYDRDIKEVCSGGYVLYDSSWPLDTRLVREDVSFLGVPFAQLCNQNFKGARERILMKNIAYAGALVALLGIDTGVIDALLDEKFGKKPKLLDSNHLALRLGLEYARENFDCPLPVRLEAIPGGEDTILVDGNTAAALGCLYAGATVAAWYPITPSTSLMDAFTAFCEQYRRDPETGRNNHVIIQAEDELAAIGIVVGAAWAGARAFTSTSGPGVSLMNEILGLAYYAEIPAVLVDVQRTGPSTGMPTRTQQADIMECAYASHGDTKHILLFPGDPKECFELAVKAFDLAERFQTPVIMLSDLDIGMNDWVVPKLSWDDGYVPDRGMVLDEEQLTRLKAFRRYAAPDADFVTARTLPGVSPLGAYFARGSGHTESGVYTEIPDEYQQVVDRLARKHVAAARHVPDPVIERRSGASVGVVTVGSCDLAVREALVSLESRGISCDYLRVRAFPFGDAVDDFLATHDPVFVVEQNRDAQLRSLLVLETGVDKEKLRSILYYGGFPLSASTVVDSVTAVLEQGRSA